MTQKISRKRALDLAMDGLNRLLAEKYATLEMAKRKYSEEGIKEVEAEYAELAAALAYIENLARQKELL